MSATEFDLLVIGAGPGGYVAAIRAAQLGMRVVLIDKRADLGGTCLNVGCIPSKALLHSTHEYERLRALAGEEVAAKSLPLEAIHRHRQQTVAALRAGVKGLVSRRGITIVQGAATVVAPGEVKVGEITYRARHILLATGSRPASLPLLPFNGISVISSDEAIALERLPRQMVIIGGGAIGLELGQVWSRLGVEVSIVEFMPQIAAGYDSDVAAALERSLTRRGLKIYTSTHFTDYKHGRVEADREGEPIALPAEVVLVSVGRVPYTEGLGLSEVGVELDRRGRVKVDANFQTNIPGIYAIGDIIEGPMLAHKAEEEGAAFAERLAGGKAPIDHSLIPGVIYTDPEVASVGLTERAAAEQGRVVKVGKFNFTANGRALAGASSEGFVKIIADASTDRLLGVQVIGSGASELISSAVAHMTYGGSAEDLARTCHAHPTLSEALKEAAMAVDKRAIHSL
jgi:dihydrolipoamide dehydrogenase